MRDGAIPSPALTSAQTGVPKRARMVNIAELLASKDFGHDAPASDIWFTRARTTCTIPDIPTCAVSSRGAA